MTADERIALLLLVACMNSAGGGWHLLASHAEWSVATAVLFGVFLATAVLTAGVAIGLLT